MTSFRRLSGSDARVIGDALHAMAKVDGYIDPREMKVIDHFLQEGILYGPGKAANAGGVAVSGLEMAQNSARRAWSRGTVDERLHAIMQAIHDTCRSTAEDYGVAGNYMHGANIAGFTKVADAMLDQGVV